MKAAAYATKGACEPLFPSCIVPGMSRARNIWRRVRVGFRLEGNRTYAPVVLTRRVGEIYADLQCSHLTRQLHPACL